MLTYKLEKDVILYKNQFEKFALDIFGDYRVDRYSLDLDGILFRIKYMYNHNKNIDNINDLKKEFIDKTIKLRSSFGEIVFNIITQIIGIIDPYKIDDINDILIQDVDIDPAYVKFKMILISYNENFLNYINNSFNDKEVLNIFPNEYFRFFTDSYNDGITKAYPELFESREQTKIGSGADHDIFIHNFTFQTSERCSLNCFPKGTKILMEDFTHKDISDIQVGDIVLGFEEFNEFYTQRSLIPTKVVATSKHMESCYKISHPSFKQDLYVTPEHPFLTARGDWVKAIDLRPSDGLMMTNFDPDDFYDVDINSIEYIKGYFISGFMGDGCTIKRKDTNGYDRYFMRFAVKDDEMIEIMKKYSIILGFNFRIRPFNISTKFNLWKDALFSSKRTEYEKWETLTNDTFNDENMMKDPNFLMGFLAGIYDAEGGIQGSVIRIHNSDRFLLSIVEDALNFLHIKWDYDKPRRPANKIIYTIRILGGSASILKMLLSCKQCIKRKGPMNLIGKSLFHSVNGYNIEYVRDAQMVYNFETTEHTYIANKLQVHNCTYCYQFNKSNMRMDFETAKEFIDNLLADKYGYINRYNSPAIIIEFIGGEPLLEISLTRKIYEYFLEQCYELNHPWFTLHRISICSNGLQYFDDEVQSFFKDYSSQISFNISIDGNKELHDSCRIQPNGEGSYDICMAALNHFNKHYAKERNSKMTLAPENISYLYDSVVDFINHGMSSINLNCVFEEGWNQNTANTEYYQLKKLTDYILENDLEHIYLSIFNERQEDKYDKSYDGSFCGGSGAMLALRPNGQFYPCIRYMPTSVGNNVRDLCLGDVKTGMVGRDQQSEVLKLLDKITRRGQNNDICYECPLSNDCASCLALGHTVFGDPNKRTTFTCIQMIAEHLANVYYWNRIIIKHPDWNLYVRKNVCPDEWSLLVIDQKELDELKLLECTAMIKLMEYKNKEMG